MANEPIYIRLAGQITDQIQQGKLAAGTRLPSVREACALYEVSPSTVLSTYRMLEDRGLIEAKPQSGFYVKSAANLPLPRMRAQREVLLNETDDVDHIERVLGVQTRSDVIDLSLASPRGSDFYPTGKLKRIMSHLLRQHPELTTDYPFPPGSLRLRQQIVNRADQWGVELTADEVVITNGCTEALQLALHAVCKPGQVVGLESPTYFALIPLIKSLGLSAIEIPTHPTTGLSLDALELLLSEKRLNAIIAQPTVQNPLGVTMSLANKKRFAELVNEYKVPLIEDTPHADLFYGAVPPNAVKAFDQGGWVLLCSSYSKSLAPGFRIGWVAPGRFIHDVLRLKIAGSLGQPGLLEETLAEYLENGGYDHHLRMLRRHFMGQMERLRREVALRFPAGTRATSPSGGCLLWVEFPKEIDTFKLFERALEEGVTVAPGALYSVKGRYNNCVRLSCCYPWSVQYESALTRFAQLAPLCLA